MKENKPNFNWNKQGSIKVPKSVIEQLDKYKEKNGYTSRPQAIISALERAEKIDTIKKELRNELNDFFEKYEKTIVKTIIIKKPSKNGSS